MSTERDDSLSRLMRARSVAIVGASERPDAPAAFAMRNLAALGFTGQIHPVHPSAKTVFGLPVASSLSQLADPVDAVVIGISADKVVAEIASAAQLGIRAAVILASGFAELDQAGSARQTEIGAIAADHSMAICGPNCLGFVNLPARLALYSSRLSSRMRRGHFSIVSHSGASAIALGNLDRLGIATLISAGNGAVTDAPDYLRYLAHDDETKAVGLVLESIRDPAAFNRATAMMQAAGKPVIALHVGRSAKGAEASKAHTGALVSSADVFSAFLRQAGIVEVKDLDEFVETAVLMTSRAGRPKRSAVGAMGVSGGGLAHFCDMAEEEDIELAVLGPTTHAGLRRLLPAYARAANPLDVTGIAFGKPEVYRDALRLLAGDAATGLIVAAQDAPDGLDAEGAGEYAGIIAAIAEAAAECPKPIVVLSQLSSGLHPALRGTLEAAGVPLLHGTRAGLRAIRNWMEFETSQKVAAAPIDMSPDPAWLKRFAAGGDLGEDEALAFLSDHGFPVPRRETAGSAEAAVAAADRIGYPVALKINSPDLPHKSDVGGVRVGLSDAASVRTAFASMLAEVAAKAPDARLEGVLVQEMIQGGVEAILGLASRPPFGHVLLIGSGGVLAEMLDDTALAIAPVDADEAARLIGRTKLAPLLQGYRGAAPRDSAELAEAAARLSRLGVLYGGAIDAIDLNPVAVLSRGRGICVLDAFIQLREGATSAAA